MRPEHGATAETVLAAAGFAVVQVGVTALRTEDFSGF